MAENWIKLEKNKRYEIIQGGLKGESGLCVDVREGHFDRSWGKIDLPRRATGVWVRASYLSEVRIQA